MGEARQAPRLVDGREGGALNRRRCGMGVICWKSVSSVFQGVELKGQLGLPRGLWGSGEKCGRETQSGHPQPRVGVQQ